MGCFGIFKINDFIFYSLFLKSTIELKSLVKSAGKIGRAGVEFLYDTL